MRETVPKCRALLMPAMRRGWKVRCSKPKHSYAEGRTHEAMLGGAIYRWWKAQRGTHVFAKDSLTGIDIEPWWDRLPRRN